MKENNEKFNRKRNILQIIIIIAIMLIPTLYTTIFLGSMWDPYGNINNLPVAVVNLDKATTFDDKEFAIGDEIVNKLRNNNSLNFNFVDEKTAQIGLDTGKYYMIITIPEDFSKNATTLINNTPQKMKLFYKINPGKNYIASKMCETAAARLKDEIDSNITKTYAETVYEKFSDVGDKLGEASNGAKQLDGGTLELKNGCDKISNNLKTLANSSLTFSDGVSEYQTKLNQYLCATNTVKDGASALNDGIDKLNSKTDELSSGINQLYNGSKKLNDGLSQLSSQLGESINKLDANIAGTDQSTVEYIISSLESLKQGVDKLQPLTKHTLLLGKSNTNDINTLINNSDVLLTKTQELIRQMYGGLKTVNTAVNDQVLPGSNQLYNGLGQLDSSVPALKSGVGTLNIGANKLYNGIVTLTGNNLKLSAGINQISKGANSINSGSEKLYNGSVTLSDGINSLENGCNSLYTALDKGANAVSNIELSDESKDMFASPIYTEELNNSYVDNNGNAMSAYMMCVGLWVGCLALCIMFSAERDIFKSKSNPRKYWLQKILKLTGFAIIQAVIMVSMLILINGLSPLSTLKTFAVAISASLSFISIVYFLNLLCGKLGSYLLLVFMILQLSGSAGTYPLELSGKFFNSIHNFMPFTYAVDGFRNSMSTGLPILPQLLVLIIITVIFALLTIFTALHKVKSTKPSFAMRLDEIIG